MDADIWSLNENPQGVLKMVINEKGNQIYRQLKKYNIIDVLSK